MAIVENHCLLCVISIKIHAEIFAHRTAIRGNMRKIYLFLLLLLMFILAGCSNQPEPTAPVQNNQTEPAAQEMPVEEAVPTEAPPAVDAEPVEEPSEAMDESVQQVSTRPQLVEFYADW